MANAIWLCQACAKLIDNDTGRFTAGMLEEWRGLAESFANLEVTGSGVSEGRPEPADVELLRFFAQCLDRPAFQDPFRVEGSMEAFDRALEDTLIALNTGCLRDREGRVVAQARGKSFLRRHEWRRELDAVADLIRAIRSRYAEAVKRREIHISCQQDGQEFYCIHDHKLGAWMDATRAEVLRVFSKVCEQAGLPAMRFPRQPWGHW